MTCATLTQHRQTSRVAAKACPIDLLTHDYQQKRQLAPELVMLIAPPCKVRVQHRYKLVILCYMLYQGYTKSALLEVLLLLVGAAAHILSGWLIFSQLYRQQCGCFCCNCITPPRAGCAVEST